jgi:polynucleotide 5'-hydroxyl-kinase GRC3/NOL9
MHEEDPSGPADVRVSDAWPALLSEVQRHPGRVIVCGAPDSGKSTFCWWLAEALSAAGRVAVVDADVGQSRIGPPACVGWRMLGASACETYFVGDVAPVSRPTACLAGTVRLARRAQRAGADWTIVDTTGWVSGPGALNLKHSKVDLLAPVRLVLIAREGELDGVARPWRRGSRVAIDRLEPRALAVKTSVERARWRETRFGEWLAGSSLRDVDLGSLSLVNTPPLDADPALLHGLLVGFLDAEGLMITLGLLQSVDWRESRAVVLCRPEALGAVGLRFGLIALNPDGTAATETGPRDRQGD